MESFELAQASLSELEERLVEIDQSLMELANYNLRSGSGSIGYRSADQAEAKGTKWIEVELPGESTIDQVVLVPEIWRFTDTSFNSDGFPLRFQVIVYNETVETVVAEFGPEDQLLPRIAPIIISFASMPATRIRIQASELTARQFDGLYSLDLSEIMVFSGEKNIALRQPVKTSHESPSVYGPRKPIYAVDGFVPYIMDAALNEISLAVIGEVESEPAPYFVIDLETPRVIDRIHLHAVELSDTVPRSYVDEVGIPRHLLIEGAMQPDFSDAQTILDIRYESIYELGPIMMHNVPATTCRYIRLTALEPHTTIEGGNVLKRFGFAEVEVFSDNQNVALHKPIIANFTMRNQFRAFSNLTDGRNYYGQILTIRGWMSQLAKRHDLEMERPLIAAELSIRYAAQKNRLLWTGRLAAFLAALVAFVILIDRYLNMRKIAQLKERFAADLHDELGANLHTIGILSDLAESSKEEPEALTRLHQRIRNVTEQTGIAVRHCTNMLQAKQLDSNLVHDMQRAAQRILAKLDHTISVEGETCLLQMKATKRLDLFLFYKECLINISRHSNATTFSTRLSVGEKALHLCVSDNGDGLRSSENEQKPMALQRRARLLKGKMTVTTPKEGGTCIELKLNLHRRPWSRNHKN